MAMNHRVAAVLLALLMLAPADVEGQAVTDAPERELPAWMTRWSPLAETGAITRALPTAGIVTPMTILPAPRVGLLWSAGNPAGLAWDIGDPRLDFAATRGNESGALRRPLDGSGISETRVRGSGWRSLGSRGRGIGGARFGQTLFDPGTTSNVNAPYATPQFVVMDSSSSATERTQVQLDGAGGWSLGDWGLGVALGYDTRSTQTVNAGFVRSNRAVLPTGSLGIARRISESLSIGVHSTWHAGNETINLSAVGAAGQVFVWRGYQSVPGATVFDQPFYRRISRDAVQHNASLAGAVANVQWTATAGSVRREDRFTAQRANNPTSDLWNSDGYNAGVSLLRPFQDDRLLLAIDGRFARLNGQATFFNDSVHGLTTEEQQVALNSELRWRSAVDGWIAVAQADVVLADRRVDDAVAARRSQTQGLTNRLALDVERAMGRGWSIAGGAAYTRYSGTGTIPDPAFMGAFYQRVFAPELDIATSPSSATAFSLGARWRARDGSLFWAQARSESLSLRQRLDYVPDGARRGSSILVGVVLP